MSSGNRFRHESIQEPASIVKYLQALSDGFENEALMFSSEDQCLVLKPHGMITLEVDAKNKDGEIKLNIKLRWRDKGKEPELNGDNLIIKTAGQK